MTGVENVALGPRVGWRLLLPNGRPLPFRAQDSTPGSPTEALHDIVGAAGEYRSAETGEPGVSSLVGTSSPFRRFLLVDMAIVADGAEVRGEPSSWGWVAGIALAALGVGFATAWVPADEVARVVAIFCCTASFPMLLGTGGSAKERVRRYLPWWLTFAGVCVLLPLLAAKSEAVPWPNWIGAFLACVLTAHVRRHTGACTWPRAALHSVFATGIAVGLVWNILGTLASEYWTFHPSPALRALAGDSLPRGRDALPGHALVASTALTTVAVVVVYLTCVGRSRLCRLAAGSQGQLEVAIDLGYSNTAYAIREAPDARPKVSSGAHEGLWWVYKNAGGLIEVRVPAAGENSDRALRTNAEFSSEAFDGRGDVPRRESLFATFVTKPSTRAGSVLAHKGNLFEPREKAAAVLLVRAHAQTAVQSWFHREGANRGGIGGLRFVFTHPVKGDQERAFGVALEEVRTQLGLEQVPEMVPEPCAAMAGVQQVGREWSASIGTWSLIDIGDGTTDFCIANESRRLSAVSFPIGARRCVGAVRRCLGSEEGFDEAEDLWIRTSLQMAAGGDEPTEGGPSLASWVEAFRDDRTERVDLLGFHDFIEAIARLVRHGKPGALVFSGQGSRCAPLVHAILQGIHEVSESGVDIVLLASDLSAGQCGANPAKGVTPFGALFSNAEYSRSLERCTIWNEPEQREDRRILLRAFGVLDVASEEVAESTGTMSELQGGNALLPTTLFLGRAGGPTQSVGLTAPFYDPDRYEDDYRALGHLAKLCPSAQAER